MIFLSKKKKTIDDIVKECGALRRKKAEIENAIAVAKSEALYFNHEESYEKIRKLDFEAELCAAGCAELEKTARRLLETEISESWDKLPELKAELSAVTATLESEAGECLGRALALLFAGNDQHRRLAAELGKAFNEGPALTVLTRSFQDATARPVETNLKTITEKIRKSESRQPGTESATNYITNRLAGLGLCGAGLSKRQEWTRRELGVL